MQITEQIRLLARYCWSLFKYQFITPWYDLAQTKGLITAVLRYDFQQARSGRLPTVSIYEVFPELPDQQWLMFGVRTPPEIPYLCAALKIIDARTVLEIGTYHGGTTLHLAANLPADGRVYTVDIDAAALGRLGFNLDEHDQTLADKPIDTIGHYCRNSPYASKITQIIQDAAQVDFTIYADRYDLIYIDGGHSYQQVKADTENVLRWLRPGGVIFWHDYHVGCTGVTRYLHELARKYPIKHIRQTTLAVWRSQ
ncbi:MAG: hypothetical protein HJJLKODD_00904 [Phycisphaerae bacterium]|nr:hypothetical protein [Phycisphaerae bacterium]